MRFERLAIPEVIRIEPKVIGDDRGYFFESYHRRRYWDQGVAVDFVQDNQSRSARGVLRGLHYQADPKAQGKLVRVLRGAIFDVAVDIRPDSPTFGHWVAETLSADNHRQLWIPAGFAHGFCALEDGTEVSYKVTEYYSPELDRGLRWDDPDIGIGWPDEARPFVLSEKDQKQPRLRDVFPEARIRKG
jgi:dTDP-4-dehydrorhamnose 3,5-epimerase